VKDIKVLGTRCASCRTTIALNEQVAQAKGVAVNLHKVEALRDIMSYGVMSTPGVVIDGKVVHAGGVPGRDKIEQWLAASAGGDSTPTASERCCAPQPKRAGACC